MNLLLLAISGEFLGLIYFFVTKGELFYTRPQKLQNNKTKEAKKQHALQTQVNSILHPFWGFVPPSGMTLRQYLSKNRLDRLVEEGISPEWIDIQVNEYGFYSNYHYPYLPQPDDFVIGILGGSVAHWFSLQGKDALIEHLHQFPKLKNRRIIVLSFAQGGFKQPQQLQILTYFLAIGQHFDFVINIDGFNEVALSHINVQHDIDISMPGSQSLLPIVNLVGQQVTVENLTALADLGRAKKSLHHLDEIMDRNNSAGLNMILVLLYRYEMYKYRKATIRVDLLREGSPGDSIMQLNRLQKFITPSNEFEYIAQLWANCSLLIKKILDAHDIDYLHVLQPNQYFGKRSFSHEEKNIALDADSLYKFGVEQGYPALIKQISVLKNSDLNFIDGTGIFDAEPIQIVYSDSCCHYNQLGNKILARTIAQEMLRIIATQPLKYLSKSG